MTLRDATVDPSADVTAAVTEVRGTRVSPGSLLVLLLAVALAATAQVLLKHGMSQVAALTKGQERSLVMTAASNLWVLAGLGIFAVSALAWLITLSRVPLNIAYPFNAIGYLAILGASVLVLHEKANMWTVLGSMMVVAGLIVVVTLSPVTHT
jgi:drug/metabolite transporter (DMT)-like permease